MTNTNNTSYNDHNGHCYNDQLQCLFWQFCIHFFYLTSYIDRVEKGGYVGEKQEELKKGEEEKKVKEKKDKKKVSWAFSLN